ncbi:MAG: molybdopterin-synthase adenylyltransferase MoeB [Thermoanaerobaculia bacterium]|nr:molybdopterin-synthase adenylyltransferase MoeB [Thermoanaerobaculia bacterium]
MSVEIRIPTPLRRFAGEKAHIDVSADVLEGALAALFSQHPGLKAQLVDEKGRIRSFVNIYVNGDDIRFLEGASTPLAEGDKIAIVPAIAGGSGALSREEIARYSRHLLLPEVAVAGQQKLKNGRVLLVGAGGLGSPAALYLAAAGVGTIGLVDFDVVDESNLQRQILHDTTTIGQPKLVSARRRLEALNPHVKVVLFEERLTSENVLSIFDGFDVVLDGTDNFATRYLTNDACFFLKKPNVYGSIFRFEGQASVFWPEKGPCYRCLYPSPPPPGLVPSCAEGGVLGVLPGVVGALQATEALKILLGTGRPLTGRLLLYDALDLSFSELKLRRDPACPLCGENRTITGLVDTAEFCGLGRGDEPPAGAEISPGELDTWVKRGDPVELIDVREPHEAAICAIDGARLIPLASLPERVHEIDGGRTIVVHCKSGARSARAVALLKQAGLTRTYNLRGGILAWAREVDPSLPVY